MRSTLLLLLMLIMAIIGRVFAEDRAIYLVLMEEHPVAFHQVVALGEQGKSQDSSELAKHLVASHDRVLETNLESGSYKKLYSFNHIVNGFAVHTTHAQAKKLELAKEVRLIEKDRGAKLMTTYTPYFLGLPQSVWIKEGGPKNAGDGIVVGIVDTGIDPSHPSFAYDPLNPFRADLPRFSGDCDSGPQFPPGSCNGKIVSARYFAAGAAASMPLNSSKDFLSPFDAVGHGSHVASIAAGNWGVPVTVDGFEYGWASGIAPHARIAIYKAIYPDIGTLADVIAAIDQATKDGVDILNLSVGPDEPPEDTLTFLNVFDITLLFARKAGIFVVQAAGNKGPAASSVISFSPWAMGVGASTTNRRYSGGILLGNGRKLPGVGLSGPSFGQGLFQYSKLVMAKDAVMVNLSFPKSPEYVEECQHPEALDPAAVRGSIVICNFSAGFVNGSSTVSAIIDTAKVMAFSGFVLVANPVYGDFVVQPLPFSTPGIMIPKISDVQILLEYYKGQTDRDQRGVVTRYRGRARIGEGRIASFWDEAPIVSRFSSRGPNIIDSHMNLADVLKPDILAPGDLIWAAWSPMSAADPILMGYNFALLSGTSMATPHVAGIAALIKQLHPSWTPSMIASAITITASEYDNRGEPIKAQGPDFTQLYQSTHFDHGAGLINPARTIDPGLVFSSEFEDYINFLCSLPNVQPEIVTAATGVACNLSLPYHPSDLNLPTITISDLIGSQSVRRTVMNVASSAETYMCSVIQPGGVVVSVHPPLFTVAPLETLDLEIKLNVTQVLDDFSFGDIVLTGSLDHIVRLPLSVFPVLMSE
ncbi:PA-domain containing subtilase family protein [Tasmannia lanceolata]|uniref:PA-domain containing subtilase family protein n=1 Tax=Tasmannia lanceolata TaxID=3420 RepID=UPI0040640EE7